MPCGPSPPGVVWALDQVPEYDDLFRIALVHFKVVLKSISHSKIQLADHLLFATLPCYLGVIPEDVDLQVTLE